MHFDNNNKCNRIAHGRDKQSPTDGNAYGYQCSCTNYRNGIQELSKKQEKVELISFQTDSVAVYHLELHLIDWNSFACRVFLVAVQVLP